MTTSIILRHEAYKASGMIWLGEIPLHWDIDRAKSLFRRMSRPISESDDIITVFRDGQVTLRKNRRTSGFTNSIKEIGYQGIRKGDLVVHAMDAFAGAVGVSDSDGKASPVYSAYIPVDLNRVYAPYYGILVRQMALSGFVSSLGKGIRERSSEFRHKEFAPLELLVPPYDEQQAIAAYLDVKTAQIDRKIDLLTQKAAKYRQLKQSLINVAVTRGLDTSVAMKDSEVAWIGDVPEHWQIMRLKDAAELRYSNVDKLTQVDEVPVALCNYVDVYKNDFIEASLPFMAATASAAEIKRFSLIQHDVLVTKDSETADDIAVPALVLDTLPGVLCGYHLAQLRGKRETMYGPYLFRLFQSEQYGHRFATHAKGITRVGLSMSAFADALTPVPPFDEQIAISKHLDMKVVQVDGIVNVINAQIDKLKELRKALINDVVTGKLRVT